MGGPLPSTVVKGGEVGDATGAELVVEFVCGAGVGEVAVGDTVGVIVSMMSAAVVVVWVVVVASVVVVVGDATGAKLGDLVGVEVEEATGA